MSKPKLCSWEGCELEVVNFPNSTLKRKFCSDHAILAVLNHNREQSDKMKSELEKVRKAKKKLIKNSNKTDHQRAMDRADEWFSKYIRFKYSFEMNGSLYCECYTCLQSYLMMAMDNGHWQKRDNIMTRFHENNARPQCTTCNDHHKGEYAKFELRLISELGIDETESIKRLATCAGENSEIFCREQAEKYRKLCNQLFKERKTSNPWTT